MTEYGSRVQLNEEWVFQNYQVIFLLVLSIAIMIFSILGDSDLVIRYLRHQ